MGSENAVVTETVCTDHLGKEYASIEDMCAHYHVSVGLYQKRLRLGWIQERALKGGHGSDAVVCTDHLGNAYATIQEMCEAYQVPIDTYYSRINYNWTQKEALTGKRDKCFDHLGNAYCSVAQMCEKYHLKPSTYTSRVRAGWTIEEVLTGIRKNSKYVCTDHNGRMFKSQTAMCKFYNVESVTYRARLDHGWTLEEALTGKRKTADSSKPDEADRPDECGAAVVSIAEMGLNVDHLGNAFGSVEALCAHYNRNPNTYIERLQRGWTKEKALTTEAWSGSLITDYQGNVFRSTRAMCRHYDIPYDVYRNRMKSGWTQNASLTTPAKTRRRENTKDYLGQTFPSIKSMCEYHHVDPGLYRSRMNHGWSQEEALTGERYDSPYLCTDHLGNSFTSITAMCKYYRIPTSVYSSRIKIGWTKEEALTTAWKKRGSVQGEDSAAAVRHPDAGLAAGGARRKDFAADSSESAEVRGENPSPAVDSVEGQPCPVADGEDDIANVEFSCNEGASGIYEAMRWTCIGNCNGEVLYEAECECGLNDILTAEEMRAHVQECSCAKIRA